MILRSLGTGFGGLLRFRGRDRRGLFWPYAALVLALVWTTTGVVLGWVFGTMIAQAEALAARYPDRVSVRPGWDGPEVVVDGTLPTQAFDFAPLLLIVASAAAVTLLLLGAAGVRRLHDIGRSGLWLLPAPLLLAFGLALFADRFGVHAFPATGFASLLTANLLYLASLFLLSAMLLAPGTRGPNRYGHPPGAPPVDR